MRLAAVPLALLILAPAARAEEPTGWKRFGSDTNRMARALFPKTRREIDTAVGIGWTAAALYAGRTAIHDAVASSVERRGPLVSHGARSLGGGAAAPLAAGILYLTGLVRHDPYDRESAQIVLTATAHAALLAGAGSVTLAAERPRDGDAVHLFRAGGHGVSLDVAIASSLAGTLDLRYLRPPPEASRRRRVLCGIGRGLLYSGVVAVALQRMEANAHWAPDVFLGAAAGFGAAHVAAASHRP